MSDVAEAGFREPRPKVLKVGLNVRANDMKRKGIYYPQKRNKKFKGEIRIGQLGKVWLGRECRLEAMMIRHDTGRKCVGLETLHFDHADYFQFFEYNGVVYNDRAKINRFLQQARASTEKKDAFLKYVKGECKRVMNLTVIKNFLKKSDPALRREEESLMQAGTAHSCSSQPATMACVETHMRSPPVRSTLPLDRNDAVLGSLDGQQVHKRELQPMPGIGLENFTRSPQIDFCCNDWSAMPMERGDWTGVCTSSPSNLEFCKELLFSNDDFNDLPDAD